MGKVKLTIDQNQGKWYKQDNIYAEKSHDRGLKSCIIGIASPSPAGNGTGSILLGHYRWWKTGVLEQSTAHRTCGDVVANQFPEQLRSRKLFLWSNRCVGQPLAEDQLFRFVPVSQQSIMTDFHKALRQNMQEKPADEFCCG